MNWADCYSSERRKRQDSGWVQALLILALAVGAVYFLKVGAP